MKNNEMQNKKTELVFIIDRSGSMYGMEKDTIGGFNTMIEKQKKQEGNCLVTTVFFNHEVTQIHNRVNLKSMQSLPDSAFEPSGSTALLDAVGMSIQTMINVQRYTAPEDRADRVLFVIITDGMENSSRRYSWSKVHEMITAEREKYGWEFIFLGANIDAPEVAGQLGIREDLAATYLNDSEGMQTNFEAMASSVEMFRCCDTEYARPLEKVREDCAARSKHRKKSRH